LRQKLRIKYNKINILSN